MNCPKCGRRVEEGVMLCRCGESLEAWQKASSSEIKTESDWRETLRNTPMKWYKFLMWIIGIRAWWAVCSYGISLIQVLNLSINKYDYAGYPELWESMVAKREVALQIGFVVVAIWVVVALFSIYVINRLKNYKKNAPKMVLIYYVICAIVGFATGEYIYCVYCVIFSIVNHIYFKKRKNVFIFE